MKDKQILNPVLRDKWYKRFVEYFLHEKKLLDFKTNTSKDINNTTGRLRFPNFYYVAMLIFPWPAFVTSIQVLRLFVRLFSIPHIQYFDFIISITCEIFMSFIIMKLIRCAIFSVCKWQEMDEANIHDYKFEYFLQEHTRTFRWYCIMSFVFACCAAIVFTASVF